MVSIKINTYNTNNKSRVYLRRGKSQFSDWEKHESDSRPPIDESRTLVIYSRSVPAAVSRWHFIPCKLNKLLSYWIMFILGAINILYL